MAITYKTFAEEIAMHFLFEPWTEDIQEYLDGEFRRRFPGNYQIIWKLSRMTNVIDYEMIFDTPQDETMFMLKYL